MTARIFWSRLFGKTIGLYGNALYSPIFFALGIMVLWHGYKSVVKMPKNHCGIAILAYFV